MNIKYQNKVRLAKYIKEHNGIEIDPRSIFDVIKSKKLPLKKGSFFAFIPPSLPCPRWFRQGR